MKGRRLSVTSLTSSRTSRQSSNIDKSQKTNGKKKKNINRAKTQMQFSFILFLYFFLNYIIAFDISNEEASKRYALIRVDIKQSVGGWNKLSPDQQTELAEIIKLWKQSADEGCHGPSQFNLGLMYREGRGVKKNVNKAAQYYEKAANQNVPKAQFNLARLYHQGDPTHTQLFMHIHDFQ